MTPSYISYFISYISYFITQQFYFFIIFWDEQIKALGSWRITFCETELSDRSSMKLIKPIIDELLNPRGTSRKNSLWKGEMSSTLCLDNDQAIANLLRSLWTFLDSTDRVISRGDREGRCRDLMCFVFGTRIDIILLQRLILHGGRRMRMAEIVGHHRGRHWQQSLRL